MIRVAVPVIKFFYRDSCGLMTDFRFTEKIHGIIDFKFVAGLFCHACKRS